MFVERNGAKSFKKLSNMHFGPLDLAMQLFCDFCKKDKKVKPFGKFRCSRVIIKKFWSLKSDHKLICDKNFHYLIHLGPSYENQAKILKDRPYGRFFFGGGEGLVKKYQKLITHKNKGLSEQTFFLKATFLELEFFINYTSKSWKSAKLGISHTF